MFASYALKPAELIQTGSIRSLQLMRAGCMLTTHSLNNKAPNGGKGSTPQLKAKVQNSATKVVAIVFFDHHGIVYCHFVYFGHRVNAHYYKGVLEKLIRVHIPCKCPEFKGCRFKLYHNNAPAHTVKILRAFCGKKKVEVMPHLAHSPILPQRLFFVPDAKKKLRMYFFIN